MKKRALFIFSLLCLKGVLMSDSLTLDEQRTVQSYDANAQEWAEGHDKKIDWFGEIEKFKTYCPSGKLLEIGSGGGRDARHLIAAGYDYTGIDISEGLLEVARKNNPKGTFLKQSLYDLDFLHDTFDGFFSVATLLHVPKKRVNEALSQIRKVVKQGGVGFITLKEGDGETILEENNRYNKEFVRLFSYYQHDEFSKILKNNGFEVLEFKRAEAMKNDWLVYFVKKI